MNPDPKHHNPDPDYLRSLIEQIGLSQRQVAKSLDINESQFRAYLVHSEKSSHRECPYVVQYALEQMNFLSNLESHLEDSRKERIENIKVGDEGFNLKYEGSVYKVRKIQEIKKYPNKNKTEIIAQLEARCGTGNSIYKRKKTYPVKEFIKSAIEDYRPRKNHAD